MKWNATNLYRKFQGTNCIFFFFNTNNWKYVFLLFRFSLRRSYSILSKMELFPIGSLTQNWTEQNRTHIEIYCETLLYQILSIHTVELEESTQLVVFIMVDNSRWTLMFKRKNTQFYIFFSFQMRISNSYIHIKEVFIMKKWIGYGKRRLSLLKYGTNTMKLVSNEAFDMKRKKKLQTKTDVVLCDIPSNNITSHANQTYVLFECMRFKKWTGNCIWFSASCSCACFSWISHNFWFFIEFVLVSTLLNSWRGVLK